MKILIKKFSLKIGDNIKVLTGNDKGKIGKIIGILKKKNSVIVEGINKRIRHITKNKTTQSSGMIKDINNPIHISNVMFWDEKTETASRIGYKFLENKKFRYLKKTNQIINN